MIARMLSAKANIGVGREMNDKIAATHGLRQSVQIQSIAAYKTET